MSPGHPGFALSSQGRRQTALRRHGRGGSSGPTRALAAGGQPGDLRAVDQWRHGTNSSGHRSVQDRSQRRQTAFQGCCKTRPAGAPMHRDLATSDRESAFCPGPLWTTPQYPLDAVLPYRLYRDRRPVGPGMRGVRTRRRRGNHRLPGETVGGLLPAPLVTRWQSEGAERPDLGLVRPPSPSSTMPVPETGRRPSCPEREGLRLRRRPRCARRHHPGPKRSVQVAAAGRGE